MADAVFYRGVGGHSFQAAEVTAMAALTQWVNLNMANLTDVAVAAEKNLPVNDDSCTCTPMQTNQNGVLTVAGCTEIVLSQRQTADIVTDKAGDFEFCFQCID